MTTPTPPAGTPPQGGTSPATPAGETPTPGERVGEVVDRVTGDAASVVRAEVDRMRAELADTAKRAGTGAALLGGAGVLGALAVGTSAAVLVRTLERVLPRPFAAVVASLLYGAGAAGLATVGVAELRRALEAAPGVQAPG